MSLSAKLLVGQMPEWYHSKGTKKSITELVKPATHGQYAVYPRKDGTKFYLMVNDNGQTTQYSIKVESEFVCSFAGKEYHSLKDAVRGIVTMSVKKPFKSTADGGKSVALTSAAIKKARKVSASQLALFDDDGGLDIAEVVEQTTKKKKEKVHVDGDGKLFLSSNELVAPVPALETAPLDDGETFDERPETPPPVAGSGGGSGGGGAAAAATPSAVGPAAEAAVPKATGAPMSSGAGLFDGLDDDGDDDADAAILATMPTVSKARAKALLAENDEDEAVAGSVASRGDVSNAVAVAGAGAGAGACAEDKGADAGGSGEGADEDDELDALMGGGDLDEDLDALLLNKTAAPATTTTTKVLTKKKTASAGLFDDDESDAADGGGVAADTMNADDLDAYINANQ